MVGDHEEKKRDLVDNSTQINPHGWKNIQGMEYFWDSEKNRLWEQKKEMGYSKIRDVMLIFCA